jgi:hypothetical protein
MLGALAKEFQMKSELYTKQHKTHAVKSRQDDWMGEA